MRRAIFRIKKMWPIDGEMRELWPMFLSGEKTSEWRDATDYWRARLVPKPDRAWIVIGFAKNSLPRLEADVVDVVHHEDTGQFEIKLENIVEVLQNPVAVKDLIAGKHPDTETQVEVPEPYKPLLEDLRLLTFDGDNPNRMTKRKREGLWQSLLKLGWVYPILVDEKGLTADGQQRIETCLAHEEYYAPVLRLGIDDKDRRLLRQIIIDRWQAYTGEEAEKL